ncbi:hypothetical protein C488_12473 [Natrinema pellirubrum DSM 15624]|uniref:Uncharacterized protein n=1 Tax=Natrinema pellirubrum (strain DSM 15624 / CIP 106293 / JCM 10476 / NCIMB 786 / 157) TaxID=797303 RepID=L0JPE8_NATP1|nr:hypothetical protein [Natrinema pellirubrum]AGB32477.1 hypothetical protein Natpe_2671 [Natrinema pellirubrum DSM 15624]ELY73617.1 hypothetical protein C488_12473 [Natrinema pellirubrum DSM 15624]
MALEEVARLADRIDSGEIVATVVAAGAVVVLDVNASVLGAILGSVIGAPLLEAAFDRYDIDPAFAWIGFGLVAVTAGIVQLRKGHHWLAGALLAAGCWLCLDGLSARRTDGGSGTDEDELTDEEFHLVALHSRWLLEELREADRPLTRAEICDRTGLMEPDFDRVLETHDGSSPIERVGNGYVLNEDETGILAAVRTTLGLVWERLVRPVRLLNSSG